LNGDHAQSLLRDKIRGLLEWERLKRRERILVSALVYALLASLVSLPVAAELPPWASSFSLTPLFFLIMTLALFLRRPWGSRESLRAVCRLDKALHLQERAVTACDILARSGGKPAETLVVSEAAEKLNSIDVRSLFKRQLPWQLFGLPPLLVLWLLLMWLGPGWYVDGFQRPREASLAQKLEKFASSLRERAKTEGLAESLGAARALGGMAERRLKGETTEVRSIIYEIIIEYNIN